MREGAKGRRAKGIILAGGKGTRLYPLTYTTSKQLLPVYDKQMIYYPMSTLFSMGINEVLIISTPEHLPQYRRLFADGEHLGAEIRYAEQPKAEGIAQSLVIGEGFLAGRPSALILGDNIFHVNRRVLCDAAAQNEHATIFGFEVEEPSAYGVVVRDDAGNAVDLIEKPRTPVSNLAIPGLYLYDADAPRIARSLPKSARGEYEITDLNREYLRAGKLRIVELEQPMGWFDGGTDEALQDVGAYVRSYQSRTGQGIGFIEEEAYRSGFITLDGLCDLYERMRADGGSNGYVTFLGKRIENIKKYDSR